VGILHGWIDWARLLEVKKTSAFTLLLYRKRSIALHSIACGA
jgi:hypothetical protein